MTREESLLKIGELVAYARTQGWDDIYTDAFKALEQEPILDKIRAEIEQFAKNPDFGDLSLGASCGAMKAIEIIDKYKAESEEMNDRSTENTSLHS
jgi:hypothetical protein